MQAARYVRVKDIAASLQDNDVDQFQKDGFLLHPEAILDDSTAEKAMLRDLRSALADVVNGIYDTGVAPQNANALPADLVSGGRLDFDAPVPPLRKGCKPRTTIHLINAWRSSTTIAQLVTSPQLGAAVTRLMQWEAQGCRVAQDQVWIKPPGSGPLSFHRDTPYLDFRPKEVCTVWIPFDCIDVPNVGALEYCRGSHQWSGGRRGSARQFYKADYTALLRIAAQDEESARSLSNSVKSTCSSSGEGDSGALPVEVDVVKTHGCGGCCSFHNGNTWHGSGPNETPGWRRGIGIHYIRGDATFSDDCGRLWQPFRHPDGSDALIDDFFPVVTLPRERA